MKKKLILLVLLVLVGLVAWKLLLAPSREGVAARYKEQEVTWKQVEQTRSVLSLLGEKGEKSDRDIVDRILLAYILADEGKALGIRVSESEIARRLKALPLPDGESSLEDYLKSLGGSLSGTREAVTMQARSALLLDRLRDSMAQEYCDEHGIYFSGDNLPEEVGRAVDEKIDSLLERHRDEIEYYF